MALILAVAKPEVDVSDAHRHFAAHFDGDTGSIEHDHVEMPGCGCGLPHVLELSKAVVSSNVDYGRPAQVVEIDGQTRRLQMYTTTSTASTQGLLRKLRITVRCAAEIVRCWCAQSVTRVCAVCFT